MSVFAVPIGVDFPEALVAGLVERMADQPPEAMARVQLYLNSGRMLRRVREVFLSEGARYLPHLRLVSDLGQDPLAGLPLAVSGLRRKLELAQLVEQLTRAIPAFEAGSSHIQLAESLSSLIAEMQSEGVHPDDLETIEMSENYAEHWRRSLEFIKIVARYFEGDAGLDAEARQRLVVEEIARSWAHTPPEDPVIVAGSTGSRGATAAFMRAVCGLEDGMVVLPGFDRDMTDLAWNSLFSGKFPIEDHPQYRFRGLLDSLGLTPGDVRDWTGAVPNAAARNKLVSLALRPAPVTDQWRIEGRDLGDLRQACAGLSLIEARDPRHEALSIALRMREGLETGRSVALITPDRLLARRVTAALDRWGIIPDDSAGQPLQLTAPGRLLRHVADLRGAALTIADLLVLLKHPLCATGAGSDARGQHLRLTRDLELALRRDGPAFPSAESLSVWAAKKPEDRATWSSWVAEMIQGFETPEKQPLLASIETHLDLTERLAAGPGGSAEVSELWREEGGREALRLMSELRREAGYGGEMTPFAYAELVKLQLQGGMARSGRSAHPRVAIWGTLEARASNADLIICGGLNEGSWPEAPAPDPWLNRQMRLEVGLLLPERQIGLSAHDFQQAMGAGEVVLSRARRDAEAETIPSRWLNRITNLLQGLPEQGGDVALAEMRTRGTHWLSLADQLETPQITLAPAPRPSPRPPRAHRPKNISVTAVQTLIRDPYAIYAKRILKLFPLDPMRPAPDPLLRGKILHEIVETFTKTRPESETIEAARERLLSITDTVLERDVAWPSTRRIWRARIARIAGRFCEDEATRLTEGTPTVIEEKVTVPLQNVDFSVTAKPDRIDLLSDGQARIFDYKSGGLPSEAEIIAFNKQMLLEAAMVERGAFADIGVRRVAGMTYVRLGGGGESPDVKGVSKDRTETPDEAWARLAGLVARYQSQTQGYTARRAMQKTADRSDYDLLARFGEWDTTDEPEPEDLT
ncbi:helicase [Thioclava dalianensis]|uniref:Helicase n=1 Tax=Thioclava dalianensis TaxID=1185766 RepID=A0A074TF15_9RHOB|nr:double-strand break repair protein AddB [Thioclava dalianensis]KEP70326.1 helicase [Thioclava dalianensis]SFN33351.1 ATP-dependent helicase/nuclease subunit B [Thioclava dalianensis]